MASGRENLAREGASARRGGRKIREKIYGNPAMKGNDRHPDGGRRRRGRERRGIGGGKEQIKRERQKAVELKAAMDEDRACHKPHQTRRKIFKTDQNVYFYFLSPDRTHTHTHNETYIPHPRAQRAHTHISRLCSPNQPPSGSTASRRTGLEAPRVPGARIKSNLPKAFRKRVSRKEM